MPITPYLVYGTVKDVDGNVIANCKVIANDTTQDTYPLFTTNSLGRYVIDLANGGWASGDSVNVYTIGGKYYGEATFVVSGSGIEQNITVNFITGATIRNKSWLSLYNHLQTGTYEISTDHIYSAMNDKLVRSVGYPFVIIEPPVITNTKSVINRVGIRERTVSFNIRIYHSAADTAKILADEVENKIDTGWKRLASLGLNNLEFPEGDYDWFSDGDKGTIHFYIIPVRFRYVST